MFILSLAVAALACGTKSNPAATCTANGQCSDPDFPYCDADGSIDGDPGACIAVTCTAGAIHGCDGSAAEVCNGSGDGFVDQACVNGCNATTGCLACLPNETSCVGSALSTCDGSGVVASSTACALGCSADSTHCNTMVPSNGVGDVLAMDPSPPDVDLENGTLDPSGATFTPNGGSAMSVPTVLVTQSDGSSLRVLVANKATLNNVTINLQAQLFTYAVFAVAARDEITINGIVAVDAGEASDSHCNAGASTANSEHLSSGAGGGGFGGAGGSGGSVGGSDPESGGAAGQATGLDDLIPLRVGCSGGGPYGGFPGGAIQLTSLVGINVNGTLDADAPQPVSPFGSGIADPSAGGGAGGALLLEAPTVTVAAPAHLFARGAGGTAADGTVGVPSNDALFQPGGTCALCGGNGGDGESPTAPAKGGENYRGTSNDGAGGGGGGLGRIRINTADGTFTPATLALIAGVMTVGSVGRQ